MVASMATENHYQDLSHRAVDVSLHARGPDEQGSGDGVVGPPSGHQEQDLSSRSVSSSRPG